MSRSLCPDWPRRRALAMLAALLAFALPSSLDQIGAIAACAAIGWPFVRMPPREVLLHRPFGVPTAAAVAALVLFALLLLGLPLAAVKAAATSPRRAGRRRTSPARG